MNGLDLIECDNPRLLPLGNFINLADLAGELEVNPLENFHRDTANEFQRRMLLKQSRTFFEPTNSAIRVISTVQDMMWNSCIMNNPLLPENRYRSVFLAENRGKSEHELHWLPDFADVLMVTGCTGLGKTTSLKRYFSKIKQAYEHAPSFEARWARYVQITYLIVPMPVHRLGLLYAIITQIDLAAGTDYRAVYARRQSWPIERLAVEVALLLVQHGVAILVIEEIQARNFGQSINRAEMLLFFLRLLNFGIAIILVGNPLGFVGLGDFSQDMNRLTENEPVHLMPIEFESTEWTEGLGPGMWGYNVMPESTPWTTEISGELYACTAAIPGYVRKAVNEVQLIAMLDGASAVTTTHLQRYTQMSMAMDLNRDLIEGFAKQDPFRLMNFLDVPWEMYGRQWGKLSDEDIADSEDAPLAMDPDLPEEERQALRTVHQNLRIKARGRLASEKEKKKEGRSVRTPLKPPLQDSLLARGLEALRKSRLARGSSPQT